MATNLPRWLGLLFSLSFTGSLLALSDSAELASIRQDVMMLSQRVGELSITVEGLRRENDQLKMNARQNYATVEQMNRAIGDMNRAMEGELVVQKRDILSQVATQLEKLGKQTNAALDSVAKNQATRPVVQTTFTDDFPKEGVNYTVQAGDTLAEIAKAHSAKLQDVVNANKISDPTKIRVGQTLFIPQGK